MAMTTTVAESRAQACERVAAVMRSCSADLGLGDRYGRSFARWATHLETRAGQLRSKERPALHAIPGGRS